MHDRAHAPNTVTVLLPEDYSCRKILSCEGICPEPFPLNRGHPVHGAIKTPLMPGFNIHADRPPRQKTVGHSKSGTAASSGIPVITTATLQAM